MTLSIHMGWRVWCTLAVFFLFLVPGILAFFVFWPILGLACAGALVIWLRRTTTAIAGASDY